MVLEMHPTGCTHNSGHRSPNHATQKQFLMLKICSLLLDLANFSFDVCLIDPGFSHDPPSLNARISEVNVGVSVEEGTKCLISTL